MLQIPKGLTILRPELDGTLDDILRRREFAATPTIPIVGITADPVAPRSSGASWPIRASFVGRAQVRPCQGGIGSTGAMVATSAGKATVGVRSRFCRQAEGIAGFCPFSSKRIGPPIMA